MNYFLIIFEFSLKANILNQNQSQQNEHQTILFINLYFFQIFNNFNYLMYIMYFNLIFYFFQLENNLIHNFHFNLIF